MEDIDIDYSAVSILSGQTTSAAIDLNGRTLCGFIMPAALTGTALSITASDSLTGTYLTLQDGDGADFSLAIAASKWIPINNVNLTASLRFIKLVSNASEGADRTIKIAKRRVV